MESKNYEFGIKKLKGMKYEAIVLQDDTHLVLGDKEMTFLFPKKKFTKIFQKQIKDKKRAYIGVSFNMNELNAISKGLGMLGKEEK